MGEEVVGGWVQREALWWQQRGQDQWGVHPRIRFRFPRVSNSGCTSPGRAGSN